MILFRGAIHCQFCIVSILLIKQNEIKRKELRASFCAHYNPFRGAIRLVVKIDKQNEIKKKN